VVVVVIVVVRTEAVPVMDPPAEVAVVVTTTAEVVVVFHTVNRLIGVDFHSMVPRILAVIVVVPSHTSELSCQRETVQIVSENLTFCSSL